MRNEFLKAFSALVGLSLEIKDDYLSSRIKAKNEQLLAVFLDFKGDGVAQYKGNLKKLTLLIKEIEELIELFLHLRVVPLSPALTARKHLLCFRLSLSRKIKSKTPTLSPSLPEKTENSEKKIETDRNLEEMILTLLKYQGKRQMREIVDALKNNFSVRTIQRYLHQMTRSGQLVREIIESYPKYSIRGQD